MDPGTQVKNENDRSRKRPAQTTEDKEIEEWAKKLITRPVPQVQVPGQVAGAQPDIAQHSG